MSRQLLSLFSLGLLSLLSAGCAAEDGTSVTGTYVDADLTAEDELVRADLGAELPAFEAQIEALSTRHGLTGDLLARRSETDEFGMTHVRVQQTVGGVPVFGGEAIVHLDGATGRSSLTDKIQARLVVDTKPELDAVAAEQTALDANPGAALLSETSLWVLRRDGTDRLVWLVDTEVTDAGGAPLSRPRLFIDAVTGDVAWSYDNLQTASGTTRYNGTQSFSTEYTVSWTGGRTYWLKNPDVATATFGNTTTSVTTPSDSDDYWTNTSSLDAVSAHWGAEMTLDYLYNSEGWLGYDNLGTKLNVYTDYDATWGNAVGGGGALWCGDGNGTTWGPLTSLDVVGHEIGHNVTEKMAALIYSGESGGMNESFSDLMGAMVERSADGGTSDNWRIGEDAYTPGTSTDALRYMSDPAADWGSADYYSNAATIGAMDVHYSSGIGNLAFYLLANGGYHPRRSSSYTYGVGPDAAMWIAFRAYRYYLTSGSDYADLREGMTLAAADGYGATSWVVDSVESAFSTVGVGTTGCETGYLEGAGSADILPGGTYFYSPGGTLSADLIATSGANVALYLYKWNGSGWGYVTGSASGSGEQAVSTSGSAGYYLWWAYSHSGASNYSFCQN